MIQTIISDGKAEFDYLQALKARQQETNADVTRAVQDYFGRRAPAKATPP